MSDWTEMYLTLDGWVADDGTGPPPGAAMVCRKKEIVAGAFRGSTSQPVTKEVLDPAAAEVLVGRFGIRPDGW